MQGSAVLLHIHPELFGILIYLCSPCRNSCQREWEEVDSQGTICQMAHHWQWHLDGAGLPPGLLASNTVAYTGSYVTAQESNNCVCILVSYYFWAKHFHGIFASFGISSVRAHPTFPPNATF